MVETKSIGITKYTGLCISYLQRNWKRRSLHRRSFRFESTFPTLARPRVSALGWRASCLCRRPRGLDARLMVPRENRLSMRGPHALRQSLARPSLSAREAFRQGGARRPCRGSFRPRRRGRRPGLPRARRVSMPHGASVRPGTDEPLARHALNFRDCGFDASLCPSTSTLSQSSAGKGQRRARNGPSQKQHLGVAEKRNRRPEGAAAESIKFSALTRSGAACARIKASERQRDEPG